MADLRFPNEIYVYVQTGTQYRKVRTCDTIKEAENWIELASQRGDYPREYTIDGTPRAWYEQTGECGCVVSTTAGGITTVLNQTCEGCTS